MNDDDEMKELRKKLILKFLDGGPLIGFVTFLIETVTVFSVDVIEIQRICFDSCDDYFQANIKK